MKQNGNVNTDFELARSLQAQFDRENLLNNDNNNLIPPNSRISSFTSPDGRHFSYSFSTITSNNNVKYLCHTFF